MHFRGQNPSVFGGEVNPILLLVFPPASQQVSLGGDPDWGGDLVYFGQGFEAQLCFSPY